MHQSVMRCCESITSVHHVITSLYHVITNLHRVAPSLQQQTPSCEMCFKLRYSYRAVNMFSSQGPYIKQSVIEHVQLCLQVKIF